MCYRSPVVLIRRNPLMSCGNRDLDHYWDRRPTHKAIVNSELKLCKKFLCSYLYFGDPIRSQFWTRHDSWAIVPCVKLLSDVIFIDHGKATFILKKWITGSYMLYEMGCWSFIARYLTACQSITLPFGGQKYPWKPGTITISVFFYMIFYREGQHSSPFRMGY